MKLGQPIFKNLLLALFDNSQFLILFQQADLEDKGTHCSTSVEAD
jgi:hypothetical protein